MVTGEAVAQNPPMVIYNPFLETDKRIESLCPSEISSTKGLYKVGNCWDRSLHLGEVCLNMKIPQRTKSQEMLKKITISHDIFSSISKAF